MGPLDSLILETLVQQWQDLVGPAQAHRASVQALDVGTGWLLEEWERELFQRLLLQASGGTIRFLEADHGEGRTHTLHLLARRATNCGLAVVETEIHQQRALLADPLELYRAVVQGLLRDHGTGLWSEEIEACRAELYPDCPPWGLALEAFARTGHSQAGRFLKGLPLKPMEARSVGLESSLTSADALHALRCLLLFLKYRQRPGVVLLADGEGALGYDRESLEAVRNLIDACASGMLPAFMVVVAVLPDFARDVVPEYPALQQRLAGGFCPGRGMTLRPVLNLSEMRERQAEEGLDFLGELGQRVLAMATRLIPDLREVRGKGAALLQAVLDAAPDEPGPVRLQVQTLARWFSRQDLNSLDAEELESKAVQHWGNECF